MVLSGAVDGRAGIDAGLVARLVAEQFPQWRDLAVVPVAVDGWDNRTYRLGDDMTVRLPTAEEYAPAIAKEHDWLLRLAPSLPVPIPQVLGEGVPGQGYPFEWSIRRWLPGRTAAPERIDDLPGFATAVAGFIVALQRIPADDGPPAGAHSFYRGDSLRHYDDETRRCLNELVGLIDTDRASAVWDAGLATSWNEPPVWFHGDIAAGNLLVRDGALVAVIDFGTSGVGDPACDLVIAWTMFSGPSRAAFRSALAASDGCDPGTWARARGWALWKAMLMMAGSLDTDRELAEINRRVIEEVLADHPAVA